MDAFELSTSSVFIFWEHMSQFLGVKIGYSGAQTDGFDFFFYIFIIIYNIISFNFSLLTLLYIIPLIYNINLDQ